jgi:hypothetical protein
MRPYVVFNPRIVLTFPDCKCCSVVVWLRSVVIVSFAPGFALSVLVSGDQTIANF